MRKPSFPIFIIIILIAASSMALVFLISGNEAKSKSYPVILNELMLSNKDAIPDENGNFYDWLELYNTSDKPVDISGCGLTDKLFEAAKWAFPAKTVIEPGGFIVVYCSGEAKLGAMHTPFKLSATDGLTLSDPSGNTIDSLELRMVTTGSSLGRNENSEWVEFIAPSPGFINSDEGAASYASNLNLEIMDNGVRLNEFMASNATTLIYDGEYPDWIELYNTTGSDVDISGCGLSDNILRPKKWVIPEGTIIKANSPLLIYCTGRDGLVNGVLHAGFALSSFSEDIVFSGANGAIIDSYTYNEQQADISMARVPDGSGAFNFSAQPSPGFLNTEQGFAAFMLENPLNRGELQLSEAMNNNSGSLLVKNTSPDWVELYNSSSSPINLNGYALSDNPKNPAKWVFPDYEFLPNTYLTVLATGNDIKDNSGGYFETNFGLSGEGDVILLYSPAGELIDKLQLKNVGFDISYGYVGNSLKYFDAPSPGQTNEGGYDGVTQMPVFSITPGIYDNAVELSITAETGARVFYTDDSKTPTSSSQAYTGPITINKNTVIRAIAIKDGYLPGSSLSGTYLFTTDGVNHTLPVATLVFDPDDLWDSKKGIYAYGENYDPDLPYGDALGTANFYKSNFVYGEEAQSAWERPAHFAIFDEVNKRQVFSQNISSRIAGGFGRGRAQKGFSLIARAEYGSNRMNYNFFDNRPFTEYKSLTLRAGAQDQNRSKIRDELATGLLEGTDVNILRQAYKPYVLYLNGEYWGVYFLKEKRSRFFVAAHEGVADSDNLDLLKGGKQISHGSNKEWLELVSYANSHDLSVEANYKHVESIVDVESFMDYIICEIYSGNTDHWNIQYYKLPDGKFKWVYYDFCWGFNNINHNSITYRRDPERAASDLFNALLKNASWRDAFLRRFAEILNTVYSQERINAIIDELYAAVEPEIEREREKFNVSTFMGVKQHAENLGSYKTFTNEIEFLRKFAKERPAAIKAHLKNEFDLSDSYMQEVFG